MSLAVRAGRGGASTRHPGGHHYGAKNVSSSMVARKGNNGIQVRGCELPGRIFAAAVAVELGASPVSALRHMDHSYYQA
jgi:hypothetical protein